MSEQNRINVDQSMKDLLSAFKKDIFLSFNCHAIATVQSFSSSTQKISCTIAYKQTYLRADPATGKYNPVLADYPMLIDCPVAIPRGGQGSVTFPIQKGDSCLVFFNDRDFDNWATSGQVTAPASNRLHSTADGIAFVSLSPFSKPITDYDTDKTCLRYGNTKIRIGAKVKVNNDTRNLYTVLNNLVSQVQSLAQQCALLTVTGITTGGSSSGVPANAAAITAIATQLTTTATQLGEILE